MSEIFQSPRGMFIGVLFVALICILIWTIVYGRRLAKTEVTDLVFGNPMKALGGYHWVISGVATVLLLWLYFSWDAARAFFPNAANELCQIAKVESAVIPMRTAFPFEERLLRGTNLLNRDKTQLDILRARAKSDVFDEAQQTQLGELVDRLAQLQTSLASPTSLSPETTAKLEGISERIDVVTAQLDSGEINDSQRTAIANARETQPGWGQGKTEVPGDPVTERGALFDAIAPELTEIAADYIDVRNASPAFLESVAALQGDIGALGKSIPVIDDFRKQLNKMLKRIDDGAIFPPGALDKVEQSLAHLHKVQLDKKGSLKWIDAVAMPGGKILSGNTACSEQGSGRWLPKPSDTVATFAKLANPSIGFKNIPLLSIKQKPLAEMVGFLIPDWIADLVPGAYPRHQADGTIGENLKSKVLNIATGNFPSISVPVPTGHIWDSIMRVLTGLFLGIVLGVPLGLLMGLSRLAKGFFDPLIELYRPVPPLAWAPLILTIFGIQDDGKIFLLFMVAFAIMVISARTGATGTQLSKIHASHSLGASRWQILRNVILPNSLPEILTGVRISIGVCWGTLVAAEMLAGTTGVGFVENVARKQSDYEIIWITIIILGLLGLMFDLIMRWIINKTIPWRGKG